MQERDIKEIVFSGFESDKRHIIKNAILENKWSYELELFLVTLKSINLNRDMGGNVVDYSRLDKELELWENYRHGGDTSVMATLRGDRSSYWEEDDDSLLTRLLAIILSNEDRAVSKGEVLKHTLYFTGKPARVLDSIVYSSILSSVFKKLKDSEILEELKRDLIELSIVDDIVDKNYMVVDLEAYDGDYVVDFERARIEIIMAISIMEPKLQSILTILETSNLNGDGKYREFLRPLVEKRDMEYSDAFLDEISAYIYKLRKGRVSPRSLEVQKGEKVDIFKMQEGEVARHPLLNKIQLLSISERDGFEVRLVQTRSGVYRFFTR